MAQVENNLTVTARVGGRHRRLATEKQLRAAIAKGELDRKSEISVERPGAEKQVMVAENVPELAGLFDEMLGAKPAPQQPAPEVTQQDEQPHRSAPVNAESDPAPSLATAPIQRSQPPASDRTLFERAEAGGAINRNSSRPNYRGGASEPSPVDYMVMPLKRYAEFHGRSSRSEYWWFQLAVIVAMFGLVVVAGGIIGEGSFGIIALAWLGVLIPSFAVTVRRLHDSGLSGTWLIGLIIGSIIPIVNFLTIIVWFILMVLPGNQGQNRFGPDPLDPANAEAFS
ncbi:DUF805 domain-containing protein [Aurantiacibacter sediminis]|nr:DUF805 domain-containing protein [Aurantiacibacter sediminis]